MKQLEGKIISLYNEYKEFDEVVKEKNKAITEKKTSVKDIIKDISRWKPKPISNAYALKSDDGEKPELSKIQSPQNCQ